MSNTSVEDIVEMTIQKTEPSSEELDTFKSFVSDWFKFDDQIRKLDIALKERKNYQRTLNKKIQDFIIQYGYNDLNTQHGRIKSNVREVKEPVKMKDVKQQLCDNKELTGEELYDLIFNAERKKTVKQSIRRIIPKVSLDL